MCGADERTLETGIPDTTQDFEQIFQIWHSIGQRVFELR